MADSMVSAVSAMSVAANPNAGTYSAPAAASFSSALFDQTWKPVQNAQGQSQYDIARTTAETAAQRAQALRSGALQRQLAGQGLSDSGIALKQGQLLNQDVQSSLQSGIAGINTAELANAEQARQAAMQRQFGAETNQYLAAQQTSERLGTQAFTGKENAANRSLQQQEIDIAAKRFGLEEKTFDAQQKELWGWTDGNGVKHQGKYDLLSNEDKRAADALYGANMPDGTHIRGRLENDSMIADLQALNTKVGVDSFYGYTDPATGQRVMGSGEIAAQAFGLKSRELADQEKELFGYSDPKTGEFVPGRMSLLSSEDKRAAAQLYGYTDPLTGQHIDGTLELSNAKNDIERQGLTIQQAQLQGWTDKDGVFHKGSLAIEEDRIQAQRDLAKLDQEFQMGMLDRQQVMATDKMIQQTKAERYYSMGQAGQEIPPAELAAMTKNDPLAYESYMSGKSGKAFSDVQKSVDMTNQYRETQIANLDDPDLQAIITRMFASWGVEEAAQDQAAQANGPKTVGGFGTKDFATLDTGAHLTISQPTISTSGITIPPGSYQVTRQSGVKVRGAWDPMRQDWLEETADVTYLVDASGNKIEAQRDVTSTEGKGTWWDNAINPLSSEFWDNTNGGTLGIIGGIAEGVKDLWNSIF